MGFLEEVVQKVLGGSLGAGAGTEGGSNPLVGMVMQMISNQPGGLAGLVQSFQQKGLGDIVSSWVSNGQNLTISAEQIHHVLGGDQVKQLAASTGVAPDQVGSQLASLLPMIVDKLTPNGQVADSNHLLSAAMSILKPSS